MSSLPTNSTHITAQGASSIGYRAVDRPERVPSPYLLHPDPAARIQVELVDHPVALPGGQFDALLVDSECEV